MTEAAQLPFDFGHRPSTSGDDFLIAPGNRDAVAWIDRWPDWPAPALVVYGPPGCGKTHLAQVFVARSGARVMAAADVGAERPEPPAASLVVDDADQVTDEEALLHLYNSLAEAGGHMLLTASQPPTRWEIGLADLASRLRSAPAVAIGKPDDDLIAALLVKLFSDRQLRIDADTVAYTVARMERSFDAARRLVAAVDRAALAEQKEISPRLIRRVLDAEFAAP
jgi:chromosomal replication initiation ATPase DnaA